VCLVVFLFEVVDCGLFDIYTRPPPPPPPPPTFPNFESSPSVIRINDQLYMKDQNLHSFVSYNAKYPPVVQFSGLWSSPLYDNTTCANRCCKKVDVLRDDWCDLGNWTQCATLNADSFLPRCGQDRRIGCSAWVPCEANPRVWFYVPWALMFVAHLFVLVYALVWMAGETEEKKGWGTELWLNSTWGGFMLLYVAAVILFSFSLVAVSDYKHWRAQTETALDFIAYQECARFCNDSKDPIVVQTRFCAGRGGFDVFDANHNIFLNGTTCPVATGNAAYCQNCYGHVDDWIRFQNAFVYLEWQVYTEWVTMLIVLSSLFIAFDRPGSAWLTVWYVAACVNIVLHLAFFSYNIYIANDSFSLGLFSILEGYGKFGQTVTTDVRAVFIVLAIGNFCYLTSTVEVLKFIWSEVVERNEISGWAAVGKAPAKSALFGQIDRLQWTRSVSRRSAESPFMRTDGFA
jgi:hypothetical protein